MLSALCASERFAQTANSWLLGGRYLGYEEAAGVPALRWIHVVTDGRRNGLRVAAVEEE